MTTRPVIHEVLHMLWASLSAWPPESERDATERVWFEATDRIEDVHFISAVEKWARTENRRPTISQILELAYAFQNAARSHAQALPAPPARDIYPIADRRAVGRLLGAVTRSAVLAATWAGETKADKRTLGGHAHLPRKILDEHGKVVKVISGIEACPLCSLHDWDENGRHELNCRRCLANAYARYNEIVLHYDADFEPGFEPETGEGEPKDLATYTCRTCHDLRWIEQDGAVRPCRHCNQDAHLRWADGHFAPNHECAACRDVRRGVAPKGPDR